MRKAALVALALAVSFNGALAVQQFEPKSSQDFERLAVAPKQINGIGRMVVNITDLDGQPIQGAYAHLDSNRTDGFVCESWASTNVLGLAALPPIHMGKLKLKIKAKGYREQTVQVPFENLSEPVIVKLQKK